MRTTLSPRKAKKRPTTIDDEKLSQNNISRSEINESDVDDDGQLDPYAILQYRPGSRTLAAAEAHAHAAGKPLSESIEGK